MIEDKNLLQDIIEEISEKNYKLAIIATYEFTLSFFEDYFIRVLPKDTFLLVDEEKYNNELKKIQPSNKFLNLFINKIIKVNLKKGVFHPKILLFLGDNEYSCYILSANLTKSGFTRNLELISKCYEKNIIFEVIKKIRKILDICFGTAKEKLKEKLSSIEAIDIKEANAEFKILSNDSEPIMNQFLSNLKDENFKELYICTPYLDTNPVEIIKKLDELNVENRFFIIQDNNEFTFEALKLFQKAKYNFLLFKDSRFLHAKFVYLLGEKCDYILLGSANLTKQAMMRNYIQGNCELTIFSKLPSESFKNEYLDYLELNRFENISDLKYSLNVIEKPNLEEAPKIIDTYIQNNRLNIEVFGNYQEFEILIYNSQNELIKRFNLKDCEIREQKGFHKIIIKCSLKIDLYKIILKNKSIESNLSYFTTDFIEYSIEYYSREIFNENFQEINIPLLFKVAERTFHEIIRTQLKFNPINLKKLLPTWRTKIEKNLRDLYNLLISGLRKINQYFERIYFEELEENENRDRIKKIIIWELENVLSLPLDDYQVERKMNFLENLLMTIARLDKIEALFDSNLKLWKLFSFLIFFKNHRRKEKKINSKKLYTLLKKASIKFEIEPEVLHKMLLSNLDKEFTSIIIKKIEFENYVNKESIEILKNICEIY